MEACVVVCRTAKTKERRDRVLFINAVSEVARARAQSFLEEHIQKTLTGAKEEQKSRFDIGFI